MRYVTSTFGNDVDVVTGTEGLAAGDTFFIYDLYELLDEAYAVAVKRVSSRREPSPE